MKNKFGFVLVKPQLGENIGAAARSLKNFGFRKLNLVSPKFIFPNQKNKSYISWCIRFNQFYKSF